jgi:hypothetical protein
MTGPGWGGSERSAYSAGVEEIAAYREPQKQPASMLVMRWHLSSQDRLPTEDCQGFGRQTRLEDGLCN